MLSKTILCQLSALEPPMLSLLWFVLHVNTQLQSYVSRIIVTHHEKMHCERATILLAKPEFRNGRNGHIRIWSIRFYYQAKGLSNAEDLSLLFQTDGQYFFFQLLSPSFQKGGNLMRKNQCPNWIKVPPLLAPDCFPVNFQQRRQQVYSKNNAVTLDRSDFLGKMITYRGGNVKLLPYFIPIFRFFFDNVAKLDVFPRRSTRGVSMLLSADDSTCNKRYQIF